MDVTRLIQVAVRTGWIIEVSLHGHGYRCWVVNPALDVVSDGCIYQTSSAALAAGRLYVERH